MWHCFREQARSRRGLSQALNLALFSSAFELAFQQFVDLLRVGLAFGGFHGLADEEAEHLAAFGFVCRAVLFNLFGIGCEHFVQYRRDRAAVSHLLEAALVDDLVRAAFAVGHRFKHNLGDFAGDGVVGDAQQHAAQLLGRDRRLLDVQALFVQQAAQFNHHPVGRQLGVAADARDFLEVIGLLTAGGQDTGVVDRQTELRLEALAFLRRQFRQGSAHVIEERVLDHHRQQVRIGEVTVVVGFLFAAHWTGFVLVRIVQASLLDHFAAVFDQLDLTAYFAVDRLLDKAERVDVLDLAARAEFDLAFRTDRHVAVATQRAFGHVAVADPQIAHQRVDGLDVGHGFLGAAHVRLGNDLQQRRARTVQVNAGGTVELFVQAFTGVFFQVRTGHADTFDRAVVHGDVQVAFADDRQFHLADLVALGQVRVEIVFTGEHVVLADLGIDCQAEHHRHAHRFLVQHWQYAGHAQVYQAGLGVRLGTEGGGTTGKNFRPGGELGMNLQPDHDFPLHVFLLRSRLGCGCASQCVTDTGGQRSTGDLPGNTGRAIARRPADRRQNRLAWTSPADPRGWR